MHVQRINDDDLGAIRSATATLLAAVNASDVHGVLGVWADDGILMPPDHPAVHGRAELQEYFGQLFVRARFTFEFTSSEIELAGDAAFERVSYRATAWPASGGQIEDAGKGLHVYRRQADGGWKLSLDIWNSDLPT
jgi:uncharacterized protein (TIGR02246 family)